MRSSKNILVLLFVFSVTLLSENYALKNFTNQRVRSFHCINHNYVFPSWFCDGINDCGDGSDEAYGCDQAKCGIGNFTCQSDNQCLPIAVRCNNITDCDDGSDESFCFHEPPIGDCSMQKGKFLCNDSLRCLDINRVCDEELHCIDGSDEGGKCDDYDPYLCNTCHHACFRTPLGPQCFFNATSDHYDPIYRDIQGCATNKNNYCDQKCIAYHDVNQCSCAENFVINSTPYSSFTCEEKDKNKNWLIYTVKGAVRGIQGYSNVSTLIKETSSPISAIAAGNDYVYWGRTYENQKVIEKTSIGSNFGSNIVLISNGIGEVNAIDVDWRTGNIYFIDNVNKRLSACRSDGQLCIEVQSLSNTGTSLALSPREGVMFWSMKAEEFGFVIMRGDMNGQNSYPVIDEGLGDIYSIACDEAAGKLYWLDSSRRKIEVTKFNGDGRKIFKSDLRVDYLSITVNARYLYWIINPNTNGSKANPNNPNNIYFSAGNRLVPKIALNGSDPVLMIYGYSYSEKTTKMTSPCNWGCSNGICLIHSAYFNKTGSDCVCANASDHKADSWCSKDAESYLGYSSYHNYDDFYPHYTESPHQAVRIILVIVSVIILVSGISFYLYRKGCFQGVDVSLFRHVRLR
ncbi:vitellogenin receptor-like [Planococcus citri]|uniref:vitellogenin receptor-like n=1 Tax=Planococcus citri TaxID=170843 RepID=UPI0031F8F0E0